MVEDEPDEKTANLIQNLYYASLIHSGYLVKDPFFFSKSVFSLINTAFEIDQEISEINVSQEDVDAMEEEEMKEREKNAPPPPPEGEELLETVELDPSMITGEG